MAIEALETDFSKLEHTLVIEASSPNEPFEAKSLLNGDQLDFVQLMEFLPEESKEAVVSSLTEIIAKGGNIRLFGSTLLKNLHPAVEIEDLRNAAVVFANGSFPLFGGRNTNNKETLFGLISHGCYDKEQLLKNISAEY